MRYALVFLLSLILILAACDNPTADTPPVDEATPADVAAPTAETNTVDTPADGTPEISAEGTEDPLVAANIALPLPGTIQAPATEEALAPEGRFDSMIFEQTGGPNNTTLTIEVYGDGRVVRNGVESTVSETQLMELENMLRELNFFGLQGQFTVPGAGEDIYRYRITVEQDGGSRMINAQDGYTPPELLELFAAVSALGA
ncbi:MAG: hypothetical protein K8L99_21870 [Anaerolineae bacterium]|nr:hypothetical protein [Anaerolineae bacterium]